MLKEHFHWHQLQCSILFAIETNRNEVLPQWLGGLVEVGAGVAVL